MHQHGNGHGADAAGDGRNVRGLRGDGVELDVADQAVAAFFAGVFHAVDADVDYIDAVFDHICGHEIGASDRGDENVRLACDAREVGCA